MMEAALQPGRVFDDIKNDQVQYGFMPIVKPWKIFTQVSWQAIPLCF